jgi:Tol biopolymer transport system component
MRALHRLLIGAVLAIPLAPSGAHAGCDNIPTALDQFRAAQGAIGAPYAVPGQSLEIRVRPQVCDGTSSGLGEAPACVDPASLRVTLLFEAGGGAPVHAMVLAPSCGTPALQSALAAWAAQLAPSGGTVACQDASAVRLGVTPVPVGEIEECRLGFRFPAVVGPLPAPEVLSGPARIVVQSAASPLPTQLVGVRCADALATSNTIACIDELYRIDGSCSTREADRSARFPGFVALPRPNDFGAMTSADGDRPPLRFALDARGTLLAPFDWTGVLCQTNEDCEFEQFPPPQLVQVLFPESIGSGLDATGARVSPGLPLDLRSSECCASLTLQGKELPPLFDPSTSAETLSLFGSTDAVQTVIRVQLDAPGRCAGDGAACFSDVGCAEGERCDLSAPDVRLADLDYCRHPNTCAAPDDAPGAVAFATPTGGPGTIPPALYAASTGGFVPLEALNVCRESDRLSCVLRDEELAGGVDVNDDGDATDPSVIELTDRRSGARLPIGATGKGLATTLLFEPPAALGPFPRPFFPAPTASSVRPLVAVESTCAAILVAEPWENHADPLGWDANGDGEAASPIVRVFCLDPTADGGVREVAVAAAEAAGLGASLAAGATPRIIASPRTLSPFQGGAEPLVIADRRVYFLLDEIANTPKSELRVDVNTEGAPGQGPADGTVASANGSVVCFASQSNLIATASPAIGRWDVYCHDFATREVDLVSRVQRPVPTGSRCDAPLGRPNASSEGPSVSADGRRICFESDATNLLDGPDGNGARDVFVYDRDTCATVRVSVGAGGAEATQPSSGCRMAADGRSVVFTSKASLSSADGDGFPDDDVYAVPLLDASDPAEPLVAGAPIVLSADLAGRSQRPSASRDGRRIAFENVVGGETTVVVRELVGDVPVDLLGFALEGRNPRLSDDGHLLGLERTDATGSTTAFVLDLETTIARQEDLPRPVGLDATLRDVGADSSYSRGQGERVAFKSTTPLVPGDAGFWDVHVRDLPTGFLKRVGLGAFLPELSGDGSTAVYVQPASNGSAAFRNGPDPDAPVDLDGNGSARDRVLAVLDLTAAPPVVEVLGAATQAAVGGPTAAFLVPDGRIGVRSCAPGQSCPVSFLLAPDGGAPAHAERVAASATLVCALLAPDHRVACAAPGEPQLQDLGITGRALGVTGDIVVFLDDASPPRLRAFAREAGGFAPRFVGAPGTRRFVLSENGFAAFDRCEVETGTDLNGDGFEDECVLDLVDLRTGELRETQATVQPCTLAACDRRFPWRLFPSGFGGSGVSARFLTLECQEDGSCDDCGDDPLCTPNGRSCDLDGNGSCADLVVREIAFGGTELVLAGVSLGATADPLAGFGSGGSLGNDGAVFPSLVGRCDEDRDPATPATTIPCAADADCPAGLVCGPPFSVLALNDADGDGLFDGFDNCPDVYNPDQTDTDGDGIGDACQAVVEVGCGDGVVQPEEFCDDGASNGTPGSFCTAQCTPLVRTQVSEQAVNPGKQGSLPVKVLGSPLLNLDTKPIGDLPAQMIEPGSLRLEGVVAGSPCSGLGAAPTVDLTKSAQYARVLADSNNDGYADLALHFSVPAARIERGDDEACLTGWFRLRPGQTEPVRFEARGRLNVK